MSLWVLFFGFTTFRILESLSREKTCWENKFLWRFSLVWLITESSLWTIQSFVQLFCRFVCSAHSFLCPRARRRHKDENNANLNKEIVFLSRCSCDWKANTNTSGLMVDSKFLLPATLKHNFNHQTSLYSSDIMQS